MKKLFKNITTKRTIKKVLIGLFILFGVYSVLDGRNVYIDMYNFEQIGKIENILSNYSKETYNFKSLKEFNTNYKVNIIPIQNCYYVSKSISSEKGYLLGFKYYSFLFSLFSYDSFYSFPKYSAPSFTICNGSSCYDLNKEKFIEITSNPCEN